ncbi:MAG: triose-phosphate isomerase, partial [Actinomycetota bacterium]
MSGKPQRRPLVSGNWKMNLNHYEAIQVLQKLNYLVSKEDFEQVDVSIHPPFTDLRSVQTLIEADELRFVLGAQNCHHENSGAYTGEVAAPFLAKLGVRYVICGHSERRQMFGETDEIVAAKVGAVLAHGMTPIVCVGETQDEREADQTLERVTGQVRESLKGRSSAQVAGLVVAYEPIWAIGTGLTATADDAQTVCRAIRRTVAESWDDEAAGSVRVQYGGSVKAGNIAEIMSGADVDGVLVGGASLDPDEFARIVQ